MEWPPPWPRAEPGPVARVCSVRGGPEPLPGRGGVTVLMAPPEAVQQKQEKETV